MTDDTFMKWTTSEFYEFINNDLPKVTLRLLPIQKLRLHQLAIQYNLTMSEIIRLGIVSILDDPVMWLEAHSRIRESPQIS